ncbi:N-acetylmuramoyl-L-alanine amidase family protein [Bacillus cereus group sp. BfR-BA-01310]|uniref:N-acetylmuramoyl-L-alanine amidase family protein n=1 Tax=Bacillus cereus group sp. BfR-BA-01310 TaxID=2920287 RepID=UPI001F564CA6|nr:cell wall-binding protein [Bacillus cereus group sp. BfR-BA-01310]
MNEKYKKRIPKVLPVGIAMGILFSASPLASPLTENKVQADVDTFGTIVTTFGKIYDAFLAEPFGKWLEKIDAQNSYAARLENVAYKAPTFKKGEFGISTFDYYKNKDFSKKVKIAYVNGKVEYKTIKHGEQIRIKDAGTIVDLNPDEPDLSKHDTLYITQKQLDEGNTGVSLTNFKTYYLKSDNSGGKNVLADRFERQEFPGYYLSSGVRDLRYVNEDLFSKLPEDKRMLATITSQPVSKEEMVDSAQNNQSVREDMQKRILDILTERKAGEYSTISTKIINDGLNLQAGDYIHEEGNWDPNGGTDFTITPVKKGSDKVFITSVFNGNVRYLTSKKLGDRSQWVYTQSENIGSDEIWTLVNRENGQFSLQNNKGEYIYVPRSGRSAPAWTTTDINTAGKFTARTSRDKWNHWLIDWYPGKENERKNYESITVEDGRAYDSSGDLIENSWIKQSYNYLYAGSDGVLLKGWQEIDGKTYHFSEDGIRASAGGKKIDGKFYSFDDDCALQRSKWIEGSDGGRFYVDASGVIIEEGLQEIDGELYYFQDYKVTTNQLSLKNPDMILQFSDKGVLERVIKSLGTPDTITIDGKQVVFERDGSIRKPGLTSKKKTIPLYPGDTEKDVIYYYSLEDGTTYTGWKIIDGKKYYFKDGKNIIFDANETIDGKKYYFNQNGEVLPTGWGDDGGEYGKYYLNDKGERVGGLQEIDGTLYYFADKGEYLSYGTLWPNWYGKYYTDENGATKRNFKGYTGITSSANGGKPREEYIETDDTGRITVKEWRNV